MTRSDDVVGLTRTPRREGRHRRRAAPRDERWWTGVVSAWVVACVAGPALGHLEIQAGKAPYLDDTGSIVGGGTTWGVVLPDEGGEGFARVCEESYDPSPAGVATASFSLLRADGAVLMGGYLGTFLSRDAGCTLEPVAAPLREHAASSVVRAGGRLLVATFDVQADNGVFASDDEGDTWAVALAPVPDVSLFRMAASLDGLRVVATGTRSTVPALPAVVVSEDGGVSWSDVSAAYAGFSIVTAGSFDEDGETLLLGGLQQVDGQYPGHVLEVAPPYTAPTTIGLFPSQVTHVAAAGGARYAVVPLRNEMYAQASRGAAFIRTHDLDGTTPEPPGPTDCVGVKPDGVRLYGCAKQNIDAAGLFLESDDGVTWRPAIQFSDVGYRVCPAGTVGAAKCARYVELQCGDGADNDFDGFTDCDDPDCGACSAEGEGEGDDAADAGSGDDDGDDDGEGDDRGADGRGARREDVDGVPRDTGAGCGATGSSGLLLPILALAAARIGRRARARLTNPPRRRAGARSAMAALLLPSHPSRMLGRRALPSHDLALRRLGPGL